MQRTVGKLKRPFGNLHYEVTGSGPALLFAHGLGGNQMSWWQQVAHFAPHYTCVAFAHRGFAPSDPIAGGPDPADYAGDLAALIDHLGFPDVRLVGQSMGGWTMLEYALAHPAKVKALVLSSTSGTIDRRGADPSGGKDYDAWSARAEATITEGVAKGIHPAIGARGRRAFAGAAPSLSQHRRDGGPPRQGEAAPGLAPHRDPHARPTLGNFPVPTLTIAGADDVVFPPFLAAAIAASLPHGQTTTLPDCGHSPYFEHAATFNSLVEAFLARHR